MLNNLVIIKLWENMVKYMLKLKSKVGNEDDNKY